MVRVSKRLTYTDAVLALQSRNCCPCTWCDKGRGWAWGQVVSIDVIVVDGLKSKPIIESTFKPSTTIEWMFTMWPQAQPRPLSHHVQGRSQPRLTSFLTNVEECTCLFLLTMTIYPFPGDLRLHLYQPLDREKCLYMYINHNKIGQGWVNNPD